MKKNIEFIIDRFEGKYAVLISKNTDKVNFPKSLLPVDIKEGDILNFSIERNIKKTNKVKKEVENLIEKLKNKK